MNKFALKEPDLHFKSLKAKIRLKISKDYQEDVIKKRQEELKALEPPIEVRDQYGRLMQRKTLLVSNQKRVPRKNRLPVKRPPIQVRKSFAAEQKKYSDADKMYNPLKQ